MPQRQVGELIEGFLRDCRGWRNKLVGCILLSGATHEGSKPLIWSLERVVDFMPLERPRRRALLRALKKGIKSFKLALAKIVDLSPGAQVVLDDVRRFLESIFGERLDGKDVFRDKSEGEELHEWVWLRWDEGDDRHSKVKVVIELELRGMILVSADVGADHPCLL
jgi:hypothetical protein